MSEDKLIWKWRWWYLHGKTDFVSRAHDGVQEQNLSLVNIGRKFGKYDSGLVSLVIRVH